MKDFGTKSKKKSAAPAKAGTHPYILQAAKKAEHILASAQSQFDTLFQNEDTSLQGQAFAEKLIKLIDHMHGNGIDFLDLRNKDGSAVSALDLDQRIAPRVHDQNTGRYFIPVGYIDASDRAAVGVQAEKTDAETAANQWKIEIGDVSREIQATIPRSRIVNNFSKNQ